MLTLKLAPLAAGNMLKSPEHLAILAVAALAIAGIVLFTRRGNNHQGSGDHWDHHQSHQPGHGPGHSGPRGPHDHGNGR